VTDSPGDPPAGTAPKVNIDAPHGTQRLWSADPLEVTVGCDSACDLRVFLSDGGRAFAGVSTSLAGAGTKRVRIEPGIRPLAQRTPRWRAVLVHACARDGTARSRDKARVRLVRPKPPPVPEPVDVRTRRAGGDVIVSWRTAFPARRTQFAVYGTNQGRPRSPTDVTFATVAGRGRTSFRVRLRHKPGLRVNRVTVTAFSTEFGGRPKDVVVRVGG
jgi:hypothetical protein